MRAIGMRAIGTAAAAAMVIGGLVGCGSAGNGSGSSNLSGNQQPLAVIQAAARATNAQRSMHLVAVINTAVPDTGTGSPGQVSMTMTGDVQIKPFVGTMTYSHVTGTATASQLNGMQALFTPKAIYLKLAALAQQVGKPWVKMTFAEINQASGVNFQQIISQAQQAKPGQYVEQLTHAGDLHKVGTGTVDGVATTHYAGFVPLKDQLSAIPSSLRSKTAQEFQLLGIKGATIDVWIDAHHLVRRSISVAKGSKGSIRVTADASNYGEKVTVNPPPASQTADLGKLIQQQGGSLGNSSS
jgi:hypothetical protein